MLPTTETNPSRPAKSNRAFLPLVVSASALVVAVLVLQFLPGTQESAPSITRSQPLDLSEMTVKEAEERSFELTEWALSNIYRAFEQDEEGEIYDVLATSSSGDALETLYLQRRAALMDRGLDKVGQQVHELQLISVEPRREGVVVHADTQWRVVGILGHEEHRHVRGNAYSADLIFGKTEEGWRVIDFLLKDIDRSDTGQIVETDLSHRTAITGETEN